MTLSDRDKRILLVLAPVVIVLAYWFLLLSPKRNDLNSARDQQHLAEQTRDQTVAQAAQLDHARQTFAADYAAVVRLGKAIPQTTDAPSLLVQLDRASKGTHIDFNSVTFGARAVATAPAPPAQTGTQGAAQPNGNAAAGGAPASTGVGKAAESAGNAVNSGNQASSNVNQASGGTSPTATSAQSAPHSAASTATALDTVTLTFNFTGSYFDLADFFHRLKRFVYVANNQIFVRGRLMTIDTLAFAPGVVSSGTASTSGHLTATVGATVYLSPQATGTTGGATPTGPQGTTGGSQPAPTGSQTSSVPLATAGAR
jgi:Tfp pilus assembly protein PilO